MTLNLNLPKLDDSETYRNELEAILIAIREQIETTYNDKIKVVINTTSTKNSASDDVLSYAIYLSFAAKNNFSYRLIELVCKRTDGGLPVIVNAFNGPVEAFGEASTPSELNEIIEKIFANGRTRNIILSNYRM